MNQSLYLENLNIFKNFPVDFEQWGNKDYDELCGIEKYAYQSYRYFIQPYLNSPRTQKIIDINCGKGYGLACLMGEYNFKKAIGYNSDPTMLNECKDRHSGISFYKDFIMSKQKDADFLFAFEAFNNYDNKSALLLRLSQALADNGTLVIIQSSTNENEYRNYESILQKTHGLTQKYSSEIGDHVLTAINRYEWYGDGSFSAQYADTQSKLLRRRDFYKIYVSVFQKTA